ncbi:DUF6907 domain-containing protein [Streptomyces sp. NPDC050256]|uniref:DUF6907 domain-containing protein n=1 Tax=Streptomyces sp. NPDC050256 TaxID=3365607 RepID=UPI003795B4EC
MIAQATTIPPLDLTRYGKSPFVVDAVHHVAKSADALPAHPTLQVRGHLVRTACGKYGWCAESGNHSMHASAYVEAPTPDGYGDCVLPANIMAEDEAAAFAPTIGFLDLDLTPAQTRVRCAELRVHLEKVEGLADKVDGRAPLEPATDCYAVTAPGATGALLSAEIFRSDDEDNPRSVIAVWSQPGEAADLDVAGADQLIADLEQFLPRLRALRNHLATVEAGK